MTLKVGTRGSHLAKIQAKQVVEILNEAGLDAELVIITTKGDRVQHLPIHQVGKNGVFVGELEGSLREGLIDIAVHSLKDMPSKIAPGFTLALPPTAPDDVDVFVGKGDPFKEADLAHMVVATGSNRRIAQLKHFYPEITLVPIRGNVETRIQKVESGLADGTLLAYAGLLRAGLSQKVTAVLDPTRFIPSPSQGLLGIELADDRRDLLKIFSQASDPYAAFRMKVERAYQQALNASCASPIGIHIEDKGSEIILHGCFAKTADEALNYATVTTNKERAMEDVYELVRKVKGDD